MAERRDPGVEWYRWSCRVLGLALVLAVLVTGGGRVALAAMHDGYLSPGQLAPWRPVVIGAAVVVVGLFVVSLALFTVWTRKDRATSRGA